jgi:hypothetical protein
MTSQREKRRTGTTRVLLSHGAAGARITRVFRASSRLLSTATHCSRLRMRSSLCMHRSTIAQSCALSTRCSSSVAPLNTGTPAANDRAAAADIILLSHLPADLGLIQLVCCLGGRTRMP